MALSTSNITLSEIAQALGEAKSLRSCCLSANVAKDGLNPAYCPGANADARLINLRADKKMTYFKGYQHVLSDPPDVITGTLLYNITGSSARATAKMQTSTPPSGTIYGICYAPWNNAPTIDDEKVFGTSYSVNGGEAYYECDLTGLAQNNHYWIRAFTQIGSVVKYGAAVEFLAANYAIGQMLFGGYIFSILAPGQPGYNPNIQHGLIANGAVLPSYQRWSFDTFVDYVNVSYSDGKYCTEKIMEQIAGASAARDCYDWGVNTYATTEWFLPSVHELQLFFNAYSNYSLLSSNIGQLTAAVWSSNSAAGDEWGNHYAYGMTPDGTIVSAGVTSGLKMRPFRKF